MCKRARNPHWSAFVLEAALAPQSQSEIAADEGISPRRGGVLGIVFN